VAAGSDAFEGAAGSTPVIDTHCHLTFPELASRVDEVVEEAVRAGVRGMITVSVTSESCGRSLALAERFSRVWCTAGVHPLHAAEPRDWAEVRRVAAHPKCVAWGELGLDNHYSDPPRSVQDEVLAEQLAVIEAADGERDAGFPRPIVVHCRDAVAELLSVFRAARFDPRRFVFHCFTGGPEEARKILDFGAWISFTGVVTFRNAPLVADAARLVPADRIMVETDAPYLAPEPMRKVWPNEPKHVVHTARFLADLRGVPRDEFERVLDANAEQFFGIDVAGAAS
jgi:TatD DNase family protein